VVRSGPTSIPCRVPGVPGGLRAPGGPRLARRPGPVEANLHPLHRGQAFANGFVDLRQDTFAAAPMYSESLSMAKVSIPRVEKVVNPPNAPMRAKTRNSGENRPLDSMRPAMIPMRRQSRRFT
jgi:hypothetical protein